VRRMPSPRRLIKSLFQELDSSFLRFVAVGFSNFAVHFTVFRVALALPWSSEFKAALSQLAAYAVATTWSFIWNRRFTFRSKGPMFGQALRFLTLQASMALITASLIGLTVDILELPAVPSWFVIMGGATIVNFLFTKRWVFRAGRSRLRPAAPDGERDGRPRLFSSRRRPHAE
jgi:putative flippase GtrA